MKKTNYIEKALPGKIYQIFNFGNGYQKIFYKIEDFEYFKQLIIKHIKPFFSILAYCLIPRRFCILVQINYIIHTPDGPIIDPSEINKFFTRQLSRVLISYSQKIKKNKQIKGSLFAKPYKRMAIDEVDTKLHIFYNFYLVDRFIEFKETFYNLLRYDNCDFRDYTLSSYRETALKKSELIDIELVYKYYSDYKDFILTQADYYLSRKNYKKEFKRIDGFNENMVIDNQIDMIFLATISEKILEWSEKNKIEFNITPIKSYDFHKTIFIPEDNTFGLEKPLHFDPYKQPQRIPESNIYGDLLTPDKHDMFQPFAKPEEEEWFNIG